MNTRVSRRHFLRLGAATAIAIAVVDTVGERPSTSNAKQGVYLTTDFAVPPIDADDYYDVACALALGFTGIVLDHPTDAAVDAIRRLGGTVVPPTDLTDAQSIVVVGAATHAARYGRGAGRIVLFAGDAAGEPEHNVELDPVAYRALAEQAFVVPCGDGGIWTASPRTSFFVTDDETLLDGAPCRWWFEDYVETGPRNLWGGPLLAFAFADSWRGQSVAGGSFEGSLIFAEVMVAGTRELLARLPAGPQRAA